MILFVLLFVSLCGIIPASAFWTFVAFRPRSVHERSAASATSKQGWLWLLGLLRPCPRPSSATASYKVMGEPLWNGKGQRPSPTCCFIPHKLSENHTTLNCQSYLRHLSQVILRAGQQQGVSIAEAHSSKLLGTLFPSLVSSCIFQLPLLISAFLPSTLPLSVQRSIMRLWLCFRELFPCEFCVSLREILWLSRMTHTQLTHSGAKQAQCKQISQMQGHVTYTAPVFLSPCRGDQNLSR